MKNFSDPIAVCVSLGILKENWYTKRFLNFCIKQDKEKAIREKKPSENYSTSKIALTLAGKANTITKK